MLVDLWLGSWLGMKTEIQHIRLQDPTLLHPTNRETALGRLVLTEFAFGTLAGVISEDHQVHEN